MCTYVEINLYLDKKKVSSLINVTNYILHVASTHTNSFNLTSTQVLLAKYLYGFNYFYRVLELGPSKYKTSNEFNCSTLDINKIAIEALFLLIKY